MSETHAFDVVIVGGGPGGLAALSALAEPYSADQLAEGQTQRAAHALAHSKRICPRVCVVDPKSWLSTWHRRFKALDIKWLRSPAAAHPDIFDRSSLLSFAFNRNRKHDLLDSGAVDSELRSLPEASSGLWTLPSNTLFEDFCDDLASRLPHTFVHGQADSVRGGDGDFRVVLADGRELAAKAVILALGVTGPPAVPLALADVPGTLMWHSDSCASLFKNLKAKKHVLVIGGGLTAVQLAQLALKKGCRVVLVSRRPLTTRHFDVNGTWFDRRRANRHHYEFFQMRIEDRLKHIRAARGGGSVPPMYMKAIREDEAKKRIVLKCGEVKVSAVLDNAVDVIIDGKVQRFDLILNACGHRPDCQQLPLINELLTTSPVDVVGGLPTLSQDLQWGDFKQLFVVGALASLQVGPDAGNLMGLRRAAQIVANVMDQRAWMKDTTTILQNIRGNRYALLASDSDSDASNAAIFRPSFAEASDSHGSADSVKKPRRERRNSRKIVMGNSKRRKVAKSRGVKSAPNNTMSAKNACGTQKNATSKNRKVRKLRKASRNVRKVRTVRRISAV